MPVLTDRKAVKESGDARRGISESGAQRCATPKLPITKLLYRLNVKRSKPKSDNGHGRLKETVDIIVTG
jgi:hypothetical protein